MKRSSTIEKQRNHILETSLKLIIKYGMSNISISQIAKEANIDRKTIYNHFKNIEAIASEILHVKFDKLGIQYHLPINGSGYERLEETLQSFVNYAKIAKDYFIYSYEFDSTFKKQPMFLQAKNIKELENSEIYKIIELGIRDGSINSHNLEIHKILGLIFIPLFSTIQKYYHREDIYNEVYDINFNNISYQVEMILNFFKNS